MASRRESSSGTALRFLFVALFVTVDLQSFSTSTSCDQVPNRSAPRVSLDVARLVDMFSRAPVTQLGRGLRAIGEDAHKDAPGSERYVVCILSLEAIATVRVLVVGVWLCGGRWRALSGERHHAHSNV